MKEILHQVWCGIALLGLFLGLWAKFFWYTARWLITGKPVPPMW
jgi:hypothetical protein